MTGKRSEQGEGRGRGPRGPILGMDWVATAGLAAVLAEQDAGAGIEEADVVIVPLDGDLAAEPARWRGVVGAGDLGTAVEMGRAGAVLVVAKGLEGQRPELRLLLGEDGARLAMCAGERALEARALSGVAWVWPTDSTLPLR